MSHIDELEEALDDFNTAWANRDLEGLIGQFVPEADLVLIGSQKGEEARGPEELRRLLEHFFAEPVSYRWEWRSREVYAVGDIGWVVAQGPIVEAAPDAVSRFEYTVTGVLERRDGRWLWRLFHGSEPDETHVDWDRIVRPAIA
ncbi:MAG: nuclear transport factor 2 family protein [Acidimicrobiia bacterium]